MAPRRRRVTVGVDFSGPWFEHDPAKTFEENIEGLLKEMAQFGERDVQARIGSIGTGRTRGRVRGRVRSLAGKPWHYNLVVSPYTDDLNAKKAISVMAAASGIEARVHAFRRASADQRKFKAEMQAKLLKGLT